MCPSLELDDGGMSDMGPGNPLLAAWTSTVERRGPVIDVLLCWFRFFRSSVKGESAGGAKRFSITSRSMAFCRSSSSIRFCKKYPWKKP